MLSATANANNQLTSLAYDAAGNTTGDGSFMYTFDAENRITSAAGVTYTYDGNGRRVEKSNGTLYWRSISGGAIGGWPGHRLRISGSPRSNEAVLAHLRIKLTRRVPQVRRLNLGLRFAFPHHSNPQKPFTRPNNRSPFIFDYLLQNT
jgi:hypothetical protein